VFSLKVKKVNITVKKFNNIKNLFIRRNRIKSIEEFR